MPFPLINRRRKRPGLLPGLFAFPAIGHPSYRNRWCESIGLKLPEVSLLMMHVVLDEETQRYRSIVADLATRLKPLLRNPVHRGHQDLVFRLPPAQEGFPGLVAVSVRCDPGILRVPRSGVTAINRGAHKALAIVCG